MFESGHFLICFAYDRCFLVQIGPADLLGLMPAKTSSLVVRPPHPKVAADDLFDSENLVIITPTKRARNGGVEDGRLVKWPAVPPVD